MNKILKIISLLLIISMAASSVISCAEANKGSSETTAAPDTSQTEAETADNLLTLPQVNFDGAKYSILTREKTEYEIYNEGEVGESVKDAVFRRNSRVSERYNIEIVSVPVKGEWDQQDVFKSAVTKSVVAGDCAYDLVAGYMAYTTGLATQGNFINLLEVPGVDFENKWWTAGFIENNTINGCLYMALGDISLTMWEFITCMYFNKQIVLDYNIEDIYSVVKNKNWTYEKFASLAKTIYEDLNSNGKTDEADKFGLSIDNIGSRAFVTASDISLTTTDSDGNITMSMFSDKYVDLFDKMYALLRGGENSIYYAELDENLKRKVFEENRSLFMTGHLYDAEYLRNMETDFGILPFPKYDENQAEYVSISSDNSAVFCIPKIVSDFELSGTIFEALCAESAYSVIPQYYENALKTKYSRDNDSGEMVDMLRDTLKYNFGYVHAVVIGSIYEMLGNQIYFKAPNISSYYEKNKRAIDKGLEKVVKAYNEINN